MNELSREHAMELDEQDELAGFRSRFVIPEPDLVYLDGNSLGRLSSDVVACMDKAIEEQWGTRIIRAWNEGWWEAPRRVGEKIAPLLGAAPGQVTVGDQTSVNLFKLATAALKLQPEKRRIVTDALNFPSDLYILQGIAHLLGKRHEILCIGTHDGDITPDLVALAAVIDENTALVTLSHVTFKSGYLYDMRAITDMAHRKGAIVLWDLSHSVGALPIELDACNADLAIGCTYKYLNGGPGSPAFLYVNSSLQDKIISPIWGWHGQTQPFSFDLNYAPSPGVTRFLAGTTPMLSMIALEAGLAPTIEAGLQRLRDKSVRLTQYAIELSDSLLAPHGFSLGSPREPDRRGSHVSIRHPDGYRINRALIEEMKVIPDFREPDNLRLGFAPIYTSFLDVWEGFDRIRRVMEQKLYEKYPKQRLSVT